MFKKDGFIAHNIGNAPSNIKRINDLLSIFGNNRISIRMFSQIDLETNYKWKWGTFRKILNHSYLVGILNIENNEYFLSELSLKYFNNEISITEYISSLIKKNREIYIKIEILGTLLQIFSNSINVKTIYYVFSLVGIGRSDESSISSYRRNFNVLFNYFEMAELIERKGKNIHLTNKGRHFLDKDIKSIDEMFTSYVIDIQYIYDYLNSYFNKDISYSILRCLTTYETENYIWSKSSLFKDKGEIQNLNNEYIGTLIIKEMI